VEDLVACLNASHNIIEYYDGLAELVLSKKGGQRFLEKTPSHVFAIGFLRRHFPNAQFINIFRDGRDCYMSAFRNPTVEERGDVTRFARLWKNSINARLRQGNVSSIYDVRYEELTSKPESVLRKIMDFLGETFSPRQIDPHHYSRTVFREEVGHEKLKEQINNSSVGQWRNILPVSDVMCFERIAGRELRRLGYELTNGVSASPNSAG
jgi:hypothetical protein